MVYDGTTSQDTATERLKGAEVALVDGFLTNYDRTVLASAKELKLLALNTTAYSMVDLAAAQELGIAVANVPGFSQQSAAELTIGLMFACVRHIPRGDARFRQHPVDDLDPPSPEGESFMGFELESKVLGVMGMGRIGKRVVKMALGIGMKVVYYNRSNVTVDGASQVSIEELLRSSDVVTLNLPWTPETDKIINKAALAQMKKGSVLINTGSAKLVNVDDLYEALKSKHLRAAGLDVVDISQSHPITKLDNVVFTPHIGSYTDEAYKHNLPETIVANIEAFVAGKPQNIVS